MTLAQIEITITEQVDQAAVSEFRNSLVGVLNLAEPQVYCRKAAGDLPQYVQLLGSVAHWLVLGVPIATMVGRLGTRLIDDAYDAAKKRLAMRPVDTVAEAMSRMLEKLPPGSEILFGLDVPDDRWGSVVRVTAKSDIGRQLSLFVEQGPAIHALLNEACKNGQGPITHAQIAFEPDGSVRLSWHTPEFRQRVEVLPPPARAVDAA